MCCDLRLTHQMVKQTSVHEIILFADGDGCLEVSVKPDFSSSGRYTFGHGMFLMCAVYEIIFCILNKILYAFPVVLFLNQWELYFVH